MANEKDGFVWYQPRGYILVWEEKNHACGVDGFCYTCSSYHGAKTQWKKGQN